MTERFNPNQVTFFEGAVRAEGVARKVGLDTSKIVTSRDADAQKATGELRVGNVPKGFTKHQLPFVFDKAQFFVSTAEPGAKAATHSHDEGDGIRFILAGSIKYGEVELKAGDWMYIPRGAKYSIIAGARGATMGYCYACCCAGRADLRGWLVDPVINPGR